MDNNSTEDTHSIEDVVNESSVSKENTGELMKQVQALQDEVQAQKDNYLRSVADLENYRRRMVREKEELRKNATYSMVEDFLPIIDNMTLGIAAAKQHGASEDFLKGFEMVAQQIRSIFLSHGVEELNPEGEVFNPNLHECVSLMASEEVEENKIISVVRVGYQLKERLLRPASVVVSSGKGNKDEE